jgi:hypothetical protein
LYGGEVAERNDDGIPRRLSLQKKHESERVTHRDIMRTRMINRCESRFACAIARDDVQLPVIVYRFFES